MAVKAAIADISDDAVLGQRLRLLQPRRGHRFGHDAILLAAATDARAGEAAVDLGAGVGTAGLALATRVPRLAVTLLEIDPQLAALAAENAARNNLAKRVRAVALDVAAPAKAFARAGLGAGSFDRAMMNPPFNDAARVAASPDSRRRAAHVAPNAALAAWIDCAARLLRPGGTLTMIYRADGLGAVLTAVAAKFGAPVMLPIYPGPEKPAIRVVLAATKGRRGPLAILPGLYLNDNDGKPTAQAEAILRAGNPLVV